MCSRIQALAERLQDMAKLAGHATTLLPESASSWPVLIVRDVVVRRQLARAIVNDDMNELSLDTSGDEAICIWLRMVFDQLVAQEGR
jgi:hypothetical protein